MTNQKKFSVFFELTKYVSELKFNQQSKNINITKSQIENVTTNNIVEKLLYHPFCFLRLLSLHPFFYFSSKIIKLEF